ncbi:hypothetical protein EUX98_g6577 [Antrodiella citrinella]|uniref:Uncharacterized protein n=1 Tax=Antrodiella citrinella TaxID=2447956 RepID=A0A4S4MNN5_9APHY|nr:hypothetical protein EUX98_g6577 [Antrodiella citrinella]
MSTVDVLEEQTVVVETPKGGRTHSFLAKAGLTAFMDKKKEIQVNADIPVSVVILQLRGPIDLDTLDCDIEAFVKLPLAPALRVGNLKGNLRQGVTTRFSVAQVGGAITLYLKEKRLWIRSEIAFRGKTHNVDVGLIPLPI